MMNIINNKITGKKQKQM